MSEYIINEQEEDDLRSGNGLSLRAILEMTWALRYWIILSVFVCACLAAVYLYVKPKSYVSSALVMVTTDKNAGMASSSQMSFIADMTGMQSYNSLSNEKVIIKSTPVVQSVVEELGLNVRYYVRNHFVTRETLPQEVRVKFVPAEGVNLNRMPFYRVDYNVIDTTALTVTLKRVTRYEEEIICKDRKLSYGEPLQVQEWGAMTFDFWNEARQRYSHGSYDYFMSGDHYVVLYSPQDRAREIAAQIEVEVVEDESSRMSSSSILQLVMQDIHPERAETVLARLIEKYNELTKEYYMASNSKTMEFIDKRLGDLSNELSAVEGDIKQFSTDHAMVDLESQAKLSLTTDATTTQQLQEVEVQQTLLDMIMNELQSNAPYSVLPANVGISDASIVSFITSYNAACIKRKQLLAASSESSPVVQRLTKQIDDLSAVIRKSIATQQTSLGLQRKELMQQTAKSKGYLTSVPGQKINLAQIERQRLVIEPLYILLQKKREETMLTIVAEPDIARVVEYPDNNSVLIGPNKRQVLTVAIVLGLLLPLLIVYLILLLKTKVQTPADIVSRTRLPLLGIVPRRQGTAFRAADMKAQGSSGSSSELSEAMRTIRTNIGFMSGKVLQFTSSIPGEGKSFVSTNVAISLCSIGKKVILVETDLRKGRQRKTFNLPRNHSNGLSNYLSGELQDWHDAIVHIAEFETLDVMLKGAAPPNPNELLSSERFSRLVSDLREVYDFVILDSPPYLVIADPMTINKCVDRNIYVMRAGKSDLRFVNEIDAAAKSDKLTNISIVLNDVEASSGHYKYGYGYRYGYGYGYSYGYSYGYASTQPQEKKAGWLRRLAAWRHSKQK